MEPARWERVQELFHGAADLPENERAQFLEKACGEDQELLDEVQRMLDQDGRPWLLDQDVVEIAGSVAGRALSSSFEESSPYRLLRVLGEGGTGVVYLAERKDLGNRVAIKILRDGWLSPARRERFTAEQRTLAQFDHPCIARLYDASTLPDGTPWFVMEYVDGVSITDYCSRHNSSLEDRLRVIRAVAEAVEYAHQHGVIHRDLKPSNILVKNDGSVRLLDFGIAKQLDAAGRPLNHTRTAFRQMTTAYASPEQLRSEPLGPLTDVYSLGVVAYELLAGRPPFDVTGKNAAEADRVISMSEPPKPSSVARGSEASWANLDALCLKALEKEPQRRYSSVAALIRDIDHHLNQEPVEARSSWVPPFLRRARRNWRGVSLAIAGITLAAASVLLTLLFSRNSPTPPVRYRTVAVLPLENGGADHNLDFLSLALADQISHTLDYARNISVRAPQLSRKYSPPAVDPQTAGRRLGVDTVVSGRFLRTGDRLQITLDLIDVDHKRSIWTDVFEAPVENMVATQALVAAKTRRTMAPVLGVTDFVTDNLPEPKSEEAYQLYLEVIQQPELTSISPAATAQNIEKLERSVGLDPSFSPAWEVLAGYYSLSSWWGTGRPEALAKMRRANAKVLELEPDNVATRAGLLYDSAHRSAQEGGISPGQAYRGVQDLLRRRPDSARVHFYASWLLRDAGLLQESARECEASLVIDAKDAGSRSCGVTFMLLGNYSRARDFLRLDESSETSRGISIDVLLREGKQAELLKSSQEVPHWSGYDMVLAYLQHHSPQEIASMANQLTPSTDPETNYFSAAHLAYVGRTDAALAMLKRTIEGGYCAYPGVDRDPLLASLRSKPEFSEVRSAGMRCQHEFLMDAPPAQQ